MASHSFQPPTGLRDFYPQDLLRRRYIEKLWRDTSIRHGFEEIDGPTFEHIELYKVKSGDAILNEMFGVFSGKDEAQRAAAAKGEAPYALRAEFTPTLARMYAAKAAAMPKPTKWFWMQNCFRAEKPQRGRLREFGQWNCDVIGSDSDPEAQARADTEAMAVCLDFLHRAGLTQADVKARYNHRQVLSRIISACGVPPEHMDAAFVLLDRRGKLSDEALEAMAFEFGLTVSEHAAFLAFLRRPRARASFTDELRTLPADVRDRVADAGGPIQLVERQLGSAGLGPWCEFDLNIARGLAYYTGTVFEVIAEGERAVAGGGRYDNLIELFGGPATPAAGFGMGDVVLGNIMDDKGLTPAGRDLLNALSTPAASFRPDVFVISAGQTPQDQEAAAAQVRPLVARLRRGTESKAWLEKSGDARKPWDADRYAAGSGGSDGSGGASPMHARHTYKTTKNVGKLLKEASDQHARFAVIIESAEHATLKNFETGEQMEKVAIGAVPGEIAARLATAPSSPKG